MLRPRLSRRFFTLLVAPLVLVPLALVSLSFAGDQAADVKIAQLECSGDPELVGVENAGDTAQDLNGWALQSDPPGTESFDLSAVGGLQPGASVFIQAGPFASGVFTWGAEFVFRDDDPTDYVRIVDDEGAVVDEVRCAAPEPTPTPAPVATPAGDVPNGGGLPPVPAGTLVSGLTVFAGSMMAALGAVMAGIPLLWRPEPPPPPVAAPPVRAVRRREDAPRGAPFSRGVGLAVLATAVVLTVAMLLTMGRGSRR